MSSVKSSNKILYHCDHLSCPVVMFICVLDRESDLCPKCGMIGLVMRGPVDHSIEDNRDAIRADQQRRALQELAYNAPVVEDRKSAV